MAEPMAPPRPETHDVVGKRLGIAVFLLGVVLLVCVFGLAVRDLFGAENGLAFSRLLALPATLIFKGSLLLVMGVVASAVANKGIALYQAALYPARDK